MNSKHSLVVVINDFNSLKKINENTVYININCDHYDSQVIDYLLTNGENYYYSDSINKNCGYNYVDYQTFKKAVAIIKEIIALIPNNLTPLEIARYLYIQIAKRVSYDINAIDSKNQDNSLKHYLQTSNIWGSLATGKGTVISYAKIYYYLCRICNIENEIVCLNNSSHLGNKITIPEKEKPLNILTDITKDVPFIQANFTTKYFGNFNANRTLDQKVHYITKEYNERQLKNALIQRSNRQYQLLEFLKITEKYLPLDKMGQVEIGIIYDNLLKEYQPMQTIHINNLYINKKDNEKVHFILFSDMLSYYSYNYRQKHFVEIKSSELTENLENDSIGIYLGETIFSIESPPIPQKSN